MIGKDEVGFEPAVITGQSHCRAILSPQCLEAALGGKADVVLSDMLPNVTGVPSVDQARAAELTLAGIGLCKKLLKPDGAFLVKVFHGEAFDEVLKALKAVFQTVAARKPAASRGESRENYLLARGLIRH